MPIIKSAKKRVKVTRKATVLNLKTKRTLRAARKSFAEAVHSTNKSGVEKAQRAVQSAIDQAVKKGIMSKNKAAREKRQLSAEAKKLAPNTKVKATKTVTKTAKAAPKTPAKKKPATKSAKRTTKS